ncbi:hypothetical protein OF83DRAFT_1178395 [Amylostereum chailletii]|nr:hypothetical protein OF83DRAFT_1178395 [Amylostereum chailletii]
MNYPDVYSVNIDRTTTTGDVWVPVIRISNFGNVVVSDVAFMVVLLMFTKFNSNATTDSDAMLFNVGPGFKLCSIGPDGNTIVGSVIGARGQAQLFLLLDKSISGLDSQARGLS